MQVSIRQAIANNGFLKVSSFIIGYLLWAHCSSFFTTSLWLKVPLCFYNNKQNKHIDAPETLWVQLTGKRSLLQSINKEDLALYINAAELAQGPNTCTITTKELLLNSAVSLSNYIPQNLKIIVE